jgi:hypothetical protein
MARVSVNTTVHLLINKIKHASISSQLLTHKPFDMSSTYWVFGSVVVVAFQIAFRAEIHANDVFLFFKNHF